MGIEAIALSEMQERVFTLRQRVKDEVDIPYKKEVEEYIKTHKKPFFSFTKKGKEYKEGLEAITKKYQNDPLVKEWGTIQEKCPHNYSPWEEVDGPSEQRRCSVCYHRQHRWNFDF